MAGGELGVGVGRIVVAGWRLVEGVKVGRGQGNVPLSNPAGSAGVFRGFSVREGMGQMLRTSCTLAGLVRIGDETGAKQGDVLVLFLFSIVLR